MVRTLLKKFYKSDIRIFRQLNTGYASYDYCLNSVKKNDFENFLCSLLLPDKLRSAGLIIRAFNVEVATIQDQVTESLIGQMRLQFWEDSIDRIYSGIVPQHPVCIELDKVIPECIIGIRVIDKNNSSIKFYLKKLISARRNYLQSSRFATLDKAEEYGEMTSSPIYAILLEMAGIKNLDADHAAAHLGRAQYLANLLRSSEYNCKRNIVSIPQDILVQFNVSEEDILRKKVTENTKNVYYEIADTAFAHLEAVKRIQKKLDKVCRKIFLPGVATESYLKRLQSAHFDVFHPRVQRKNHFLSLKLYWKNLFV